MTEPVVSYTTKVASEDDTGDEANVGTAFGERDLGRNRVCGENSLTTPHHQDREGGEFQESVLRHTF